MSVTKTDGCCCLGGGAARVILCNAQYGILIVRPANIFLCQGMNADHLIDYNPQYDRIFQDILPFHALSPAVLRQRAAVLPSTDFTYTLHVSSNDVSITGNRATATRPKSLKGMIEGFRHFLPEGFSLDITGSDHDLGSWVLGQDQRDRAVELVRQGKCESKPYGSTGNHWLKPAGVLQQTSSQRNSKPLRTINETHSLDGSRHVQKIHLLTSGRMLRMPQMNTSVSRQDLFDKAQEDR